MEKASKRCYLACFISFLVKAQFRAGYKSIYMHWKVAHLTSKSSRHHHQIIHDFFCFFALFSYGSRSTPSLNAAEDADSDDSKHRIRHLLRANHSVSGHKSKRLLQPQKLQPKISLIISTNEPTMSIDRVENHLRLSTASADDDDSLTNSFTFSVSQMKGAETADEQVTTYSNLMLKNPPVMPISRRRSLCRTYLSRVSPLGMEFQKRLYVYWDLVWIFQPRYASS